MTRVRLTEDPPLCTIEEAFTLLAQAKAHIEQPEDADAYRREPHSLRLLKHRAALDASLVAVEVATDTGDPHLLSAALEDAYEAASWDRLEDEYVFAVAVEEILPLQPEITNRVRECARSRSPTLRAATATGLGARAIRSLQGMGDEVDAEAARIVVALTKDADPQVRQQARESLAGLAPPAWLTFFPTDPLASRSASEAARFRAPLDAAAEAIEKGLYGHTQALVEAIAQLPDDLAEPILEAWVRTEGALSVEGAATLLDRWLHGDATGQRLLRWLLDEKQERALLQGEAVAAALRRKPPTQIIASCLRIAEELARSETNVGQYQLSGVLERAWPKEADRVPLLEAALGASIQEASHTPATKRSSTALFQLAFAPGPGLEPLSDLLIEVFLAGAPGCWQSSSWYLERTALTFRDPRLRAYAERQIHEGGKGLKWALEYLLGAGHDPNTDAPVEQVLSALVRQPTTRAAVLKVPNLARAAKTMLRAMLLQADLTPEERIDLASTVSSANHQDDPQTPFCFTDEEMLAIRAARLLLETDDYLPRALHLLPKFPDWTDEDHAFVAAMVRRYGEGRLSLILSQVLEEAASPTLLPLAEELLRISAPQAKTWARRAVKACTPKEEEA